MRMIPQVISPQLERLRSRNIYMVFYMSGAAHGLTIRCAVPAWPAGSPGPCAKKSDGLSCMHHLFPGRESR